MKMAGDPACQWRIHFQKMAGDPVPANGGYIFCEMADDPVLAVKEWISSEIAR